MNTIKYTFWFIFFTLLLSCSNDDHTVEEVEEGGPVSSYVFVINSLSGQQGGAKYIATAPSVTEGTLKIDKYTGIETDAYTFFVQNNQLMAAVFGEIGQSPLTFYSLNRRNEIVPGRKLITETIGSHGKVGDKDVVSASFGGGFFVVSTESKQITHKGEIDFNLLKYEDEEAKPTSLKGVFAVDDKVYMPFSVTPKEGDTKFREQTFIALIDYPSLKITEILRDNRTGLVGSWFGMNGIQQVKDGSVYVWSPAEKSKNPSAFIRIKNHKIDKSYFFDVEKATGGHKLSRAEYIKDNLFLVNFFVDKNIQSTWSGVVKLALVDVAAQTIKWIEDIPEHVLMPYNNKVYVEKDKKTIHYIAPIEKTNRFQIYNINVETGKVKRGLVIENATDVTAFSKLESI